LLHNFYIHIPFCRQKWPYCKFALTPIFDEFKKKRYIEYLKKEIYEYFSSVHEWPPISTIYFWGGTPSILSLSEIRDILRCFPLDMTSQCEITFECNPEDINKDYIDGLIELGINRISLWVQTLIDKSLLEIHRSSRDTIFHALHSIGSRKWISVNVDFILWLPFVFSGETISAIQELHDMFPYITHTSVYMLEDEIYPKSWKVNSLSDEAIQKEFLDIMDYFESLWWCHYELSNFSRPWYESLHNKWYWNHSEFRGFWLSASSYSKGKRWSNSDSFSGYYKWWIENMEHITLEQKMIEKFMFWLRTSDGVSQTDFNFIVTNKKLSEFIDKWFIRITENRIYITKLEFLFWII